MISFARFKGSPPVESFIHGDFSAKTRRQSFPACLTHEGKDMPKESLSVDSKKFAWWVLTGMGGMVTVFGIFCLAFFFPLDKKVAVIENQVNEIKVEVTGINNRLDQMRGAVKESQEELQASINEGTLPLLLNGTTKGRPEQLRKSLPRAQRYLSIAREKRVPANPNVIKSEGLNLLKERKELPDDVLKQQAWQTATAAAEFLTTLRSVPERIIEEAKAKGIYFEGGKYTLSVHTPKGAVYKDAEITIVGNQLDLSNVYFIDIKKFDLSQSDINEQFLTALFNSGVPAINFEFPRREALPQPKEDPTNSE